MFNFWFFYSWNGCADIDILKNSVQVPSQQDLISFEACELGVHEGSSRSCAALVALSDRCSFLKATSKESLSKFVEI